MPTPATPLADPIRALRLAVEAGDIPLARARLRELTSRKIPREQTLEVANLARRTGNPLFGCRLLNPMVRPSSRKPVEASPAEKAEYAACLVRLGAVGEALTLLEGLPVKEAPQALLYEALARFTQWDYVAAIDVLNRFVGQPGLSDYQSIIGKLNLAAALIAERQTGPATPLIQELRQHLSWQKHPKLYANLLEIDAQRAIFSSAWKEAGEVLREARQILKGTSLVDALLIEKWDAILELSRLGADAHRLHRLDSVRTLARKSGNWETVRDCDRFEAIHTGNRSLLFRLIAGTPFPAFRQRTLSVFPEAVTLPDEYRLALGGESPGVRWIDLRSGLLDGKPCQLKLDKEPHRLMVLLSSDFYSPFRLAALYFGLFPDDYFNPVTASGRVHSALHRFRDWAKKKQIPLAVSLVESSYRLSSQRPIGLVIGLHHSPRSDENRKLTPLRMHFGALPFSRKQARERMKVADRTALRLITEGMESGELTSEGTGKAIRYRFKN